MLHSVHTVQYVPKINCHYGSPHHVPYEDEYGRDEAGAAAGGLGGRRAGGGGGGVAAGPAKEDGGDAVAGVGTAADGKEGEQLRGRYLCSLVFFMAHTVLRVLLLEVLLLQGKQRKLSF